MQTDVVLTGIGGQGVQLAAKTLAQGAVREGREAMLSAHWGGEMRGGQTEASVVVADQGLRALPILPQVSSALVMHPRYWEPVRARLRPGAVVVANADLVAEADLGPTGPGAPGPVVHRIPAGTIAAEVPAPMGAGFVLLGAYSALTGLVGLESLVAAMRDLVPAYRAQHVAANEASLRAGAAAGGGGGGAVVSGRAITRGTVTIDEERCKGCELCIAACRPGVLVMSEATNEVGYRFPLLLEGCTACRACHAVCPDYVFEVYKYEVPVGPGEGA